MRNNLPNTNIVYDGPRKEEMQSFLNFLYTIFLQNPGVINKPDSIYNLLRDVGLPISEKDEFGRGKDVGRFFDRWKKNFKNRKTEVYVYEKWSTYWLLFVNNLFDEDEFIKLYIPINMPHLYEGVNQLFDFIDKEGMIHQSKVGQTMRVDNVIVRLRKGDIASANKIIDFINNNPYLRTGLNKNNPFIPTVKGIGYMNEHGNSYNKDISKLLYAYLSRCYRSGKNRVSIEEFREFVRTNSHDNSLIETFEIAYSGREPRKTNDKQAGVLSIDQKIALLTDAIRSTYSKYGYEQVEFGLMNIAMNGDYSYITNGNTGIRLREKLRENVSQNEIKDIIKYTLSKIVPSRMISGELSDNVKLYCQTLLSEDMTFRFDEICNVTLEKYGIEHLENAIGQFVVNNNVVGFSRHFGESKVDYRDKMSRIGSDNVVKLMINSLKVKGYNPSSTNLETLISEYCQILEQSKYVEFEDRPKYIM